MGLHKILSIIALVLAIVGIIFGLLILIGDLETLREPGSMIDKMMYVAYAIFIVAIVLVLIYVIKGLFSGNIKKTLISLGLFIGIFLVSYLMASGTDINLQPFIDKGLDVSETTSKYVGTGLHAALIFGIVAIASMLLSGVKKIVNK